jgi:hypothetical protein
MRSTVQKIFLVSIGSTPSIVFAAGGIAPYGPGSFLSVVISFIDVLTFKIALPALVVAIVYSAFLFMLSRGNEQNVTKARNSVRYIIWGAIVLFGALVTSLALQSLSGIINV